MQIAAPVEVDGVWFDLHVQVASPETVDGIVDDLGTHFAGLAGVAALAAALVVVPSTGGDAATRRLRYALRANAPAPAEGWPR